MAVDYPVFRIEAGAAEAGRRGARPTARGLEVTARRSIRPGHLDGFLSQAAECVRLSQQKDTQTLRYDWYVSTDGTRCEVREAYTGAEGLVTHRANVGPALQELFAHYADDHAMTVYGEPDPQLVALAETYGMRDHVTWLTRVAGLDVTGSAADGGPLATGPGVPAR